MPSLKNLSAADDEEENQRWRNSLALADRFNLDDVNKDLDNIKGEEDEDKDSKERSSSYTSDEQSEFLDMELGDIRRNMQCPICLGIIRKTRTVMGCLHRFCRECIDKSMRLGNNECPACRKHCASRRSLRDDPKFDALIAAFFRNIDRYEEEELAFHEDEKARNKQIQVSIAQVSQRQSEALVKRRSFGKETRVLLRSQRQSIRRNYRNMEHEASEGHDHDDDDNRSKDSSSDEQRRRKKRSTTHLTPNPSSSNANNNDTYKDNETEISPDLVWNQEVLAWGKGGTRSSTRHGNNPGASSKTARNARLNNLVEYLGSLEGNNVEMDIHLKLISLDTKRVPNLQQPYLRCRPTLLVKQLREYVAVQTQLKAKEVELLVSNGEDKTIENHHMLMQSLKDDVTIAKLKDNYISSDEYLMVLYRQMQIE